MATEFNPGGASSLDDAVRLRYEANADRNAYTNTEKAKLAALPAGATVNSPDATLLSRTNHTDTQLSVTISDFNSASRAQTEAELVAGTNVTITPSGSGASRQLTIAATGSGGGSVSGRLNAFGSSSATAIAGGIVSVPANVGRLILDTQASEATDDLDTISGLIAGDLLFLSSQNATRVVTIKHDTGNIRCENSQDIVLDNPLDVAFGIFDGTVLRLTEWNLAAGLADIIVISEQASITPSSAISGSLFSIRPGTVGPNTTSSVEYFRLDGVPKLGELSGLNWDSTGEPGGIITGKMRYTNAGSTVLGNEFTATLSSAASAPDVFIVGDWTAYDVASPAGDTLAIDIDSLPANNGSAIIAFYWQNGAGPLNLLSGGATLGVRNITVPVTTAANLRIYAANSAGTSLPSDTKTRTPTVGADVTPPVITGVSIVDNLLSFTLSEPGTSYTLIEASATALTADAIKSAVLAATPLVYDTFSAITGINNRTLTLTPLSDGPWYIKTAAFDAALNGGVAAPYGFTYVAPGASNNVTFVSATQQVNSTSSVAAATPINSTAAHTVGSGTNRAVIVTIKGLCAVVGLPTLTGVTFGGVAMTEITPPTGSTGKDWIASYRIMNPTSGSSDLAFTCSNTQNAISAYTQEFNTVDQTTPIAYSASVPSASSTTTIATPRTTVSNGNMILGAVVIENGGYVADIDTDNAAVVVASQTGTSGSSDISVGDSRLAMPAIGAGGHSWTWALTDRGCALIIELEAA